MDHPSIIHDHRYGGEVVGSKNSMEGKENTIIPIASLEVTMSRGGFPNQAPQTPAVCPMCGTDSHSDPAHYGSSQTLSTKDILHKCSRCDEYFCQNAKAALGKKGNNIQSGFYSVKFKPIKTYMNVDSLYQCLLCNRMYSTPLDRNAHMAKHTGVDTHMCTQCGFVSNEKSAVEAHMATHREVPSYECPMCCQMFGTVTEMDQHLTMTGHLGDTMQRCTQCSFVSTVKTQIMTVSIVKNESEIDAWTGEITHNINICITYPRSSQNKQSGNNDQKPDGESSLQQKSAVTDEADTQVSDNGSLTEDDCYGGNEELPPVEPGNLEEHSMLPVCNEQPDDMISTEIVYICKECKHVFFEESAFQTHLLTHSVIEKSIQCDEGGDTQPSTPEGYAGQNLHIPEGDTRQNSPLPEVDTGQRSHMPTAANCRKNRPRHTVREKKRTPSKEPVKTLYLKIYKCPYCNSDFSDKSRLHKHVVSHSRCSLCETTFSSPDELKKHMPTHTAGKEYKCLVCEKWFSDLLTHMTTHTGEIGKGGAVIRGLRTETLTTQEDTTLHAPDKPDESMTREKWRKPHMCSVCGKLFSLKTSLLEHIVIHGSRDYICNLCGQPYSSNGELKVHIMRHTGDKPHQCHYCGKRFADMSALKYHIATYHSEEGKPFQCSQCGKQFPSQGSINKHMKSHSKPYDCSQCDKRYRDKSDLKSHMVMHTGGLPCSYCGKLISSAVGLKRHEMLHTGETPFPCSMCDKQYKTRGGLNVHMLTHTGKRPHMCSVCGKRFNKVGYLKEHMRTHTGEKPYVCSQCGKEFAFSSGLRVHMVTHTGEKPISCSGCGRSFSFRHQLRKHSCVPKKRGRPKKKNPDAQEQTETAVAVSSLDPPFVPVYMVDTPEPGSYISVGL